MDSTEGTCPGTALHCCPLFGALTALECWGRPLLGRLGGGFPQVYEYPSSRSTTVYQQWSTLGLPPVLRPGIKPQLHRPGPRALYEYCTVGPKNHTYGTYGFRTNPLYAFKTVRPTPVPTFFRAKIVGTGTPDNVGSKKRSNGGGGGLYSVSRCR